jgi:putative oxidoreductase
MDVGILILRVLVGLTVGAHGAQKLIGLFGGHGLQGTARFLESLGFRPARGHAVLLGAVEVSAGLLLAAGLLTPLAAAGIARVMAAAIAVALGVLAGVGTAAARRLSEVVTPPAVRIQG